MKLNYFLVDINKLCSRKSLFKPERFIMFIYSPKLIRIYKFLKSCKDYEISKRSSNQSFPLCGIQLSHSLALIETIGVCVWIRSNAPSSSWSCCFCCSYAYPFALCRASFVPAVSFVRRHIVVAVACWRWQTAWRQQRRRRVVVAIAAPCARYCVATLATLKKIKVKDKGYGLKKCYIFNA